VKQPTYPAEKEREHEFRMVQLFRSTQASASHSLQPFNFTPQLSQISNNISSSSVLNTAAARFEPRISSTPQRDPYQHDYCGDSF